MAEYELTAKDYVWNRACDSFSRVPLRPGDVALRDSLRADSLIGNGGVFHVFDCLTAEQIDAAMVGFRFFGLHEAAEILSRARRLLDECDEVGRYERAIDTEYYELSAQLEDRFARHFVAKPQDFAPLE